VVDRDTGKPLPYGEEGLLVFTTLSREASPLLRYWTNDICSIYYDQSARRTHIKMSAIKGRADDMLIIRGVNLFHTQVEEVIRDFEALVPNYQLVVSREKTMDTVKVKVETKADFDLHDKAELSQQLAGKLKNTTGLSMQVTLMHYDSIPRSQGGKLSRIVDNRDVR